MISVSTLMTCPMVSISISPIDCIADIDTLPYYRGLSIGGGLAVSSGHGRMAGHEAQRLPHGESGIRGGLCAPPGGAAADRERSAPPAGRRGGGGRPARPG